MDELESLTQEIIDKLDELENISNSLSSLSPVTHKSQDKIQWYGGIPGLIKESREEKRLIKLINEPIINGMSFFQLAYKIIEETEYLVDRQLQIQQLLSKDDERYYGLVIDIFNIVENVISSWNNYSPDMAQEPISIKGEKDLFALEPTVRYHTTVSIKKMDLPESISNHYKTREEIDKILSNNSGCFGIVLLLVIGTVFLVLI